MLNAYFCALLSALYGGGLGYLAFSFSPSGLMLWCVHKGCWLVGMVIGGALEECS